MEYETFTRLGDSQETDLNRTVKMGAAEAERLRLLLPRMSQAPKTDEIIELFFSLRLVCLPGGSDDGVVQISFYLCNLERRKEIRTFGDNLISSSSHLNQSLSTRRRRMSQMSHVITHLSNLSAQSSVSQLSKKNISTHFLQMI